MTSGQNFRRGVQTMPMLSSFGLTAPSSPIGSSLVYGGYCLPHYHIVLFHRLPCDSCSACLLPTVHLGNIASHLSNNSQSPLSSVPFSSLLPSNRYPNRYLNKPNSDIDYFNNKLNSNAIKAL